ncbi:Ig-like domain-containing protein [Sphaerisporangium sp. NBC_01403]|uniref:Ig-like domain-containing protein n=1 Tax=Sphaerisporangium sp. NBC_01403 TaxID=2903599 RepID=UPI003248788B
MGALVAAPSSASANQAPQNLGTKAASLLPAAPVKPGFAVTVRRAIATTTTLTSSQNPAKKGHSVTFTATVTATGTNILPTGTVVFREGSKDLGTAQLEGVAQATYSTSSMDVGSHNITAFYQGNVSFDPSTSQVLIEKVDDPDAEKKKEEDKKKEKEKEKKKDDVRDEDDTDDDDDSVGTIRNNNLENRCRHFRHDDDDEGADEGTGSSDRRNRERREDLRRRCHRFWHRHENDFTTLIDRGIRRHVEGHYDRGGGHREFWDSRHHRWVPEHKEHYHYEKPYHHHKKHYHKHRPVVHHFAVTG